ncbi:MAG: hypothetical protein JW908_09810 [Anaerolineales bacterium]|nr:hypothetical protein [Anaerolineales bacterium]
MYEDSLEAVYLFIERAGIRLKVNEVLVECLEDGNTASFQDLIEELIVAGPDSLRIVREILSEVDLMLDKMKEKAYEGNYETKCDGDCQAVQKSGNYQSHIVMMNEIQDYLNDWLWGLIYLSTRHEWAQAYTSSNKSRWLL